MCTQRRPVNSYAVDNKAARPVTPEPPRDALGFFDTAPLVYCPTLIYVTRLGAPTPLTDKMVLSTWLPVPKEWARNNSVTASSVSIGYVGKHI